MTEKLKWRLGKLPTPDEVTKLLNEKIISKEEAREILFNLETEEDRDKKSLESEIKFLREIVQRLSTRNHTIEVVREILPIYRNYQWTAPYTT